MPGRISPKGLRIEHTNGSAPTSGPLWLFRFALKVESNHMKQGDDMKILRNLLQSVWLILMLQGTTSSVSAQEVSIPDPDLNAAIRVALQKPAGPLTEQDLLSLTALNACCRSITNLEGLAAAQNLTNLNLEVNQLTHFSLPTNLIHLQFLNLSANPLTNVFLPDGCSNLNALILKSCQLPELILPSGLTCLVGLDLSGNQLTNLSLANDLKNLNVLDLTENKLTSLKLPHGLTNLSVLKLGHNQMTNLTIPPELTHLTSVLLGGNPLMSLVLSEPAATGQSLSNLVASLRGGGIAVYTYPLDVRLDSPHSVASGSFELTLVGPPEIYTVLESTNLTNWNEAGAVTNELGSAVFTDNNPTAAKFFRARAP